MILFQRLNFCYMDPRNLIDWTVAEMAMEFFFMLRMTYSFVLLTDHRLPVKAECLFTEINIRNEKRLLCCSYNPHRNNVSNHISHLSNGPDKVIIMI